MRSETDIKIKLKDISEQIDELNEDFSDFIYPKDYSQRIDRLEAMYDAVAWCLGETKYFYGKI